MTQKKTAVLYHNDADGFASALAAWLVYGDNANYIPVRYGEPVPPLPIGTLELFILDFSYNRETCEHLASRFLLQVIDHHKTAREELAGAPYALFDMSRAGCELAWAYFHPDKPLPDLLAYVADRDLWKWELPNSEEVNAWVTILPLDFARWAEVLRDGIGEREMTMGSALLASQELQLRSLAKKARRVDLFGKRAVVVNSSVLHSELGNYLARLHPQSELVAVYNDMPDGTRKYSLRTHRPDVDVSVMARWFGGGGHQRAAGFTLPANLQQRLGGELADNLQMLTGGPV